MKILMVCLGNICRSPLAEGIMKAKVEKLGLDWHIDSAGTSAWHIGEMPDRRSISVARAYSINISGQKARQLTPRDMEEFDLILAMDSTNYKDIIQLATDKKQSQKVQLIMNFVKPGYNEAVPDPYWDDNGFEHVFHMLDNACERTLETLLASLKKNAANGNPGQD